MAEPSRRFRPALRALVLVRLKEFFREPEALFWIYGFPIILAAVQPIIRALPLTALVDALRAVMLEGASLGGISVKLMVLLPGWWWDFWAPSSCSAGSSGPGGRGGTTFMLLRGRNI